MLPQHGPASKSKAAASSEQCRDRRVSSSGAEGVATCSHQRASVLYRHFVLPSSMGHSPPTQLPPRTQTGGFLTWRYSNDASLCSSTNSLRSSSGDQLVGMTQSLQRCRRTRHFFFVPLDSKSHIPSVLNWETKTYISTFLFLPAKPG